MALIPITRVRHNEQASRTMLTTFVFEGRYGGSRVPRGIDPGFVSRFIRESLQPGSPSNAYAAVLEVIRFYETADVLPHLRQALTGREAEGDDVLRSAYVLQALGDLGTRDGAAGAADYFDRILAPHPALVTGLYPVLLDTLVALAPAGSPARMFQRLSYEVRALEAGRRGSEAGMMKYDALAAVEKNNVPKTTLLIETKKRLSAQPPDARRAELVRIYLGLSPGGAMLGVWAARLLRKEAMERSADPVCTEFAKASELVDVAKLGPERANAIIERATQAVFYLRATGSPDDGPLLAGRANFLWDL